MTQSHTVFIVDDDRFLLDMYAVKFKSAGVTASAFQNGEEMLAKLRDGETPDAILLDIVMPGLDGFGVLEVIRKEKLSPKTKVIILSNQGQDADIERATKLGAAGYIVKASAIPSEVLSQTLAIIDKTA